MTLSFSRIDSIVDQARQFEPAIRQLAGETWSDAKQSLLGRIAEQPLFAQYVRHLSTPNARNTSPWQAKGEQLYAAVLMAHLGDESGEVRPDGGLLELTRTGYPIQSVGVGMALLCEQSVPYLWSTDILDVIRHSPPLPPHVISQDLLPFPLMFWSFETAYGYVDANGNGTGWDSNWVWIRHAGDGFQVVADASKVGTTTLMGGGFRYGSRWPDDFPDHARPAIEQYLKRLAFIASPYVEMQSARLPRSDRKRMLAAGVPREETDRPVYVVVLRRAAQDAVDGEKRATTTHGVEWKHQWWVSGHYRAQWYASEGTHKVIWIAPYLKGPTDKPILGKTYAVVR